MLTTNCSIAYCPLPVLHGVSAMGTKLCFYQLPCSGFFNPPRLPADPENLRPDMVPQDRWDCDIRDGEGEQRFRAIVDEIKWICASL